ncbi:MAG: ArsA family ATPase [Acidobacteria bacterium]|nr:ArsA family ATPase [Acidobacteriota bacterium]
MTPRLTGSRVAVVSGKGGVGKTTVAAALALASSRSGKRTLLMEVEGRQGIAPVFGHHAIGYQEHRLAPNLLGVSVEPDDALVDYLQLFYGIRRIGRVLAGTKAIEFATNTAPGLRDILLIGKAKEAERRREEGAYTFDHIVIDAPPTGRLPRFLGAPRAIADLVSGGPIRQQAQGVLDMVHDPKRLQVVLVAQPEDMPVRETEEAAENLRKMEIALGPVVVNGIWPEAPDLGGDPASALGSAAARLGLGEEAIARLSAVAAAHARRVAHQREAVAGLRRGIDLPMATLPFLFTPQIARAELEELASILAGSEAF